MTEDKESKLKPNEFKFNFTRPNKSGSNQFTNSESTKDIFEELIEKNTKNQK